MSHFHDHFSGRASEYARFRPRYPTGLFTYLASLVPQGSVAWDCATGSGQAAVALADHFSRVIATDASAEQVAHAEQRPNIEYGVASAERSDLPSCSVDLITVAQALHWFDLSAFYLEAKRVLRPGGVLAVWCYGAVELPGRKLQRIVDDFYRETVGPYWPAERQWVEDGYRSLPFPFPELPSPAFAIESRMSLEAFLGYLSTWSATQRYVRATGHDPIRHLRNELAPHWSSPQVLKTLRWTLALRIGRKPAAKNTSGG